MGLLRRRARRRQRGGAPRYLIQVFFHWVYGRSAPSLVAAFSVGFISMGGLFRWVVLLALWTGSLVGFFRVGADAGSVYGLVVLLFLVELPICYLCHLQVVTFFFWWD